AGSAPPRSEETSPSLATWNGMARLVASPAGDTSPSASVASPWSSGPKRKCEGTLSEVGGPVKAPSCSPLEGVGHPPFVPARIAKIMDQAARQLRIGAHAVPVRPPDTPAHL